MTHARKNAKRDRRQHETGEGTGQNRDGELPQEACASGRVLTFGKTSEPAVTGVRAPYASGLSPQGELTSAKTAKPSFYGTPLVAWQPAAGADEYEVQWGHKAYPWTSVGSAVEEAAAPKIGLRSKTKGARLSLVRISSHHWQRMSKRLRPTTRFVREHLLPLRLRVFRWLTAPQK